MKPKSEAPQLRDNDNIKYFRRFNVICPDIVSPGLNSSSLLLTTLAMPNDILSWTGQDPRESQLFNSWGKLYRFQVRQSTSTFSECCADIFQTTVGANGKSVTTLLRTIRPNKEDRVAKFEWAANGGLGRVVIGKVCLILSLAVLEANSKLINQNMLPMADMVRPDPNVQVRHLLRMHIYKVTNVSRGRPRFQWTGRSFVPVEAKRDQF